MTITDLAVRMAAIERRLLAVEESLQAIDGHLKELDTLTKVVGDLKIEIEDRQEA